MMIRDPHSYSLTNLARILSPRVNIFRQHMLDQLLDVVGVGDRRSLLAIP